MKRTSLLKSALFVFFAFMAGVWAAEKTWWDRFFPSQRTPQILTDTKPQAPLVTPPPEVVNLQDSFAQVSDAIKPAVVNISAVQITKSKGRSPEFYFGDPNEFFHRFFGEKQKSTPREFRTEGTGSGVIIDPDGYILTNNHVVQGADQLTVTLSNNESYRGRVIGGDARTDLAVIRIKSSNPFPFASLGDSSQVRIGDWVLAIGSPFGLEQTVTAGIISAIRQSLTIEGQRFRDLLQTDAAINRGNSGGPLVNLRGEIVGINAAIYAPTGVFSGIGFAIPVNRAKIIVKDLIEKGYVERSWMGVEIGEVDDVLAKQFQLKEKGGALVNRVIPDSPSAKAGLRRGDVIVEFRGEKIKNVTHLQDVVSQTEPGKTVRVVVVRDGARKNLKLTTEVMPSRIGLGSTPDPKEEPTEDNAKKVEWLGATFSNLSDGLRQRYSISDDLTKGIVVVKVPAKSQAAEAGLAEGDVIRSLNRKKVTTVKALEKIKDSLNVKEGIVFDVNRQGRWSYLTFKSLE